MYTRVLFATDSANGAANDGERESSSSSRIAAKVAAKSQSNAAAMSLILKASAIKENGPAVDDVRARTCAASDGRIRTRASEKEPPSKQSNDDPLSLSLSHTHTPASDTKKDSKKNNTKTNATDASLGLSGLVTGRHSARERSEETPAQNFRLDKRAAVLVDETNGFNDSVGTHKSNDDEHHQNPPTRKHVVRIGQIGGGKVGGEGGGVGQVSLDGHVRSRERYVCMYVCILYV